LAQKDLFPTVSLYPGRQLPFSTLVKWNCHRTFT
jgi:hypothetical protein